VIVALGGNLTVRARLDVTWPLRLVLALLLAAAGWAVVGQVGDAAGAGGPGVSGATVSVPSRGALGADLTYAYGPSGRLTVSAGRSHVPGWALVPDGVGRDTVGAAGGTIRTDSSEPRSLDAGGASVWYSRTPHGIEQGFRLDHRPAGAGGSVVVAMASAGSWLPVATGPTSVSLLGPGGRVQLTYSGLTVTDATGRRLPAHLEASGRSIRIAFDDHGARYPVVVDPWIQQAGLAPPLNAGAFGTSVAVSSNGSTVLVGDALGGGGTPTPGAATVYTLSGGTWSAGTSLTPPAGAVSFGTSVALSASGTEALVGDPDNGAGAATVYTLSGGSWSAGTALTPPGTAFVFGTSVALSADGTVALVGDPQGGAGFGAATVYDGAGLGTAVSLAAPVSAKTFGTSVALGGTSGTTALVGDSTGGPSSRGVADSFTGASWATRTQLVEPATAKNFGTSVALSTDGATALVGDPTGGGGTGAASIETFNGTAWSAPTSLARPNGAGTFGTSVALGGSGGTTAVVGDPTGGGATGTATTYSGSGSSWSAGSPLVAPIGSATFGAAVAASADGSTALVGDPTGADLQLNRTGTVTVYTSQGSAWDLGVPANPPANSGSLGTSVSLSADGATVLEGDSSGGPGAPGGPGQSSVFTYNGSSLSPATVLAPPAVVAEFGTSVAVSADGRTAVVGDPGPYDVSTGLGGTATVYTYNGALWSAGTPLTPPTGAFEFGNSVAVSANGTEILVGDPEGGNGFGAATVYNLSGGTWSSGTSLQAPVTTSVFGTSVALSADGMTALVGDPGVPGGSVTAYSLSGGSWSTGTQLAPPAHAKAFGTSLALSQTGDVGLVGDPQGGAAGTGAATVFTNVASLWSANSSLVPLGTPAQFGTSVALSASGTTALVGDPTAASFGTATVYGYQGGVWGAGTPLFPNANSTLFGTSVALSGDGTIAAVGDPNGGITGELTVFSFDSTKLPTALTASANPTSSVVGSPVTYSATVHPTSGGGTPSGTVTFSMGLTTLCTTPALASGAGHCTASNTPIGGNGVVFASYPGDAAFSASVGSTPVSVYDSSSTAVSVNPTSTSFGTSVTYSVNVTSGGGTPTGSVAFTIGGSPMCTVTLSGGSGQCTSAGAPTGADTVTGSYSGDPNFIASSGNAGLSVARASSSTAVSVNPTSTTAGSTVTYSASVTSGGGTPTGSVAFSIGGSPMCTATLSGGSGQCTSAGAPTGTDTVTGSYSGDPNFTPSSSTASLAVGVIPPRPPGYDLVGSDGGVFVFGTPGQGFYGSLPGLGVKVSNIVGIVPTSNDQGYFLVGSDGGVFAFGNAPFENSLPGIGVHVKNIVGIVPTADDLGYFVVGSDGGVFAFGNAPFENSLPGLGVHVNNIVGIVPTADDFGYWVVSSTGAVYALGDAPFVGSLGGNSPTPIVGIAATHDSGGYWLVGKDGSVFSFGDAQSFGSLPGLGVTVSNIVAIVPTPDGQGYWLIGSDGGIFAFGNAAEIGSLPALGVNVNNIVGAVPTA